MTPGYKLDSFAMEQPVEKVWDDGAVLGGVVDLSWTRNGKHDHRHVRFADIWARRNGRWQVIYTQISRPPQ